MSGVGEKFFKSIGAALALAGCSGASENAVQDISAAPTAMLPVPHANNAVAAATHNEAATFYSFNGLRGGKTHEDVSKAAFACPAPAGPCRAISSPPVKKGRLASAAAFLHDRIFLFGGYTVAEDGVEVSTPEVFAFNPVTEEYQRRADMPTPVDDAVAFAYANRYIYLVSGWHDDGNVSLVQVLDTWEDRWFRATDYPGAPVFAHAGGAVDNKVVIADGVAVTGVIDGRRRFGAVNEAWLGTIDENDPATIDWRQLPAHPGDPLYRMAAAGDPFNKHIAFYGGADNPYNYNGVGYDGAPANPSDLLFAFDLERDEWIELGRTGRPTMDHRGLMVWDGAYWTLGGMDSNREVIGELTRIEIGKGAR